MASTFSIQSKSYDGRYLKLDLTQTKNVRDNTSTVKWTLTAVAGDTNYYSTGPTTAKLGSTQLCYYDRTSHSKKVFPTGPRGESTTGTVTVSHNKDGTLALPVSLTTAIYSATTATVSGIWTLDAIPIASEVITPSVITSAGNVELGKACSVQWTPNKASYRFKLKFSLGSWSYTTAVIHPNKTSSYIYTGYTLPLDIAKQIPESKTGIMTVTLTTYTDSACQNAAGSDSETFTVTVPENNTTRPTVTMSLTAKSPLEGIYVQGLSKVQATLSATGKLGTSIKNCVLTAEDKTYPSPYLTNGLQKTGNVVITGTATDKRGIVGTASQTITVIPYYRPKLTGVKAYRCNAQGTAAENGKYLKIEATRDYAQVKVNGTQKNFCKVRYRYRAEKSAGYSGYTTILAENTAGNTVTTSPLLSGGLDTVSSYVVEISALDTLGNETKVTVQIHGEAIFRHKRAGGKGLGIGGYCEQDDLVDVHFQTRLRKNLDVDGDVYCNNDVIIGGSVAGIYIRKLHLSSERTIKIQSKWSAFDDLGHSRQMVLLFGCDNTIRINGSAVLKSNGNAEWKGEGDVTVVADVPGQFVFTLPTPAYDDFVLISANKFSIV